MKIVEHGTRGDHWGRSNNSDKLVVHHGRGQLQLSRGQALDLIFELSEYLEEMDDE